MKINSPKEKDTRIKSLRDAVTRKDSVTLALVTSLKGVLGNIADEDIEINVEKGEYAYLINYYLEVEAFLLIMQQKRC